ncbi:hypothetical protein CHL78_009190 [Romboutsia weinsteinii]|uniref:Uncharacterized protein n=1 Tax=Romboutsia weinsteinii TaxID=2020949 RepID=A0A371J3M4_9FIRM|nr:hypothetical protein [Romboutsia weinsteinii]RDY27381.1 hypothetical protein CHL78_009190 [Romboutsia weinsteinii]
MIDMRISEAEKKVYIDVSGYITSKDARDFLAKYKQKAKGMRTTQYKLVVEPSIFRCENDDDIRTVCMTFFKHGYKKIYIVDPNNYIMNTLELGSMEKKIFQKSVKMINTKEDAR